MDVTRALGYHLPIYRDLNPVSGLTISGLDCAPESIDRQTLRCHPGRDGQQPAVTFELHRQSPATGAVAELDELLRGTAATVPATRNGSIDPHFLGLTTTRGCNIGCVYCNFGGPTANSVEMPPATAIAAVDWMRDRLIANQRSLPRVHFFGGEPLIAWNLIELVVHRVRYICAQQGWRNYIDASTNGVMSDDRLQFVGDYFGGVVLSFDGPAEFHDRNRPTKRGKSTFAAVDHAAKTWSSMPVDLCLRVCITADSVDRMADITEWMCDTYDPTVINFESLTPGDLATNAGLRVPDPWQFARGYVAAHRAAARRGIRAVYSAAEYDRPRHSFCPVGTDSPIVAPDGAINACYLLDADWKARGLDMSIGKISDDMELRFDLDALKAVRQIPQGKQRCQACFCQWSCAGGCHINQTYPGSDAMYTDFCEQTRLITTCLILDELGHPDLVDELLQDDQSMRELAYANTLLDIMPRSENETDSVAAGPELLHGSMAVLQ